MANEKKRHVLFTDMNTKEFIEVANRADPELIMSKWSHRANYTDLELAIISYRADKVSIVTHPMLYGSNRGRMYTADIPIKMIDFFEGDISMTPDERWLIEKKRLPTLRKFCADNGVSTTALSKRIERWTNPSKESDERFKMLSIVAERCKNYFDNYVINGTLLGMYNGNYGALLSKVLLGMKEEVTINTNRNIKRSIRSRSIHELSTDRIDELLNDPARLSRLALLSSGKIEENE